MPMARIKVHLLDLKGYYGSAPYQLGLLIAAARLEPGVADGIEFVISAHAREAPVETIVARVEEEQGDLVAASCYAWNHRKLVQVLEELRRRGSSPRHLVFGGPSTTGSFGEALLEGHANLSAVVEGEGEPAFRDICRELVADGSANPFLGARNTVTRSLVGLDRSRCGHRVAQLDETPSPYLEGILPVDPSPVFYETSRGCPYRCSFCYWGNGQSRVNRMSHARVREELRFILAAGATSMWLMDANFGIFPDDAEIAQLLCDENEALGRPLRVLGVNWAKKSSGRVLEISRLFARSGSASERSDRLGTFRPYGVRSRITGHGPSSARPSRAGRYTSVARRTLSRMGTITPSRSVTSYGPSSGMPSGPTRGPPHAGSAAPAAASPMTFAKVRRETG